MAITFVALFLVVILGFTAIGIDIARVAHTASEVQTVADASARAGAMRLIDATSVNGDGIVNAQHIGQLNFMNGAAAPQGDILVDEGFYDTTDNRFECCPKPGGGYNSPCCKNTGTAPFNQICKVSARDCSAKHSAVVAVPNTTVDNLFAGIFNYIGTGYVATAATGDNGHSRVEKLAVAMAGGPGNGCTRPEGCTAGDWKCYCEAGVAPCLPIAAPSCKYDCSGSTCTLPTLTVSSSGSDSAAWTGFGDVASASTVKDLLASDTTTTGDLCSPGKANDVVPSVDVGPDINVNNGIAGGGNGTPFSIMQCLVGQQPATKQNPNPPPPQGCTIDPTTHQINGWGGTIFTIPIFDLDTCTTNMNQDWPVVGFATVDVKQVNITGTPNTITLETVLNTTDPNATPGGECFRTNCSVAMTR